MKKLQIVDHSQSIIGVILANVIAIFVGALYAAPTTIYTWLGVLLFVVPFFLVFCLLPYWLTTLLTRFLAHVIGVQLSKKVLWRYGLLYVIMSAFMANTITHIYETAKNGGAGSEYMPLILLFVGVYSFWIVPLIMFISNAVVIHRLNNKGATNY